MNVYIWTSGVLKNAYIGEYYEWNWDLSKASSSNRKSATVSRSWWYWYGWLLSSDWTIYTVQYWEVGYTDQYRLSTAWDITTIGSSFYSMSKPWTNSYNGVCFGNNWRYFLTRYTGWQFIRYTLSTPRLLSTRDSWTSMTIWDVSGAADAYWFSEDGTKFIYSNDTNKKLEQSTNTARSITWIWTVILTGTDLTRWTFNTYWDYFYLMYKNWTIKKYKLPNKYDLTGMTEQQSISLSIGTCVWLAFDTLWNNMYILVQWYSTQTIYQYTLN